MPKILKSCFIQSWALIEDLKNLDDKRLLNFTKSGSYSLAFPIRHLSGVVKENYWKHVSNKIRSRYQNKVVKPKYNFTFPIEN